MTSIALPKHIMTSEPGSFARLTIEDRKPAIIDHIVKDLSFPPEMETALLALKADLQHGVIRPMQEETPDRPVWDHDIKPFVGTPWLAMPWYLAEAYFFRRVLEIAHYFQPGPFEGKDPYARLKNQELDDALPAFMTSYKAQPREATFENFKAFTARALWGNRADLSNMNRFSTNMRPQADALVLDHTSQAYQFLSMRPARIIYFFDNVGRELYSDLAWMDFLLQSGLAQSITGWAKNQPFFVSDVMLEDVSGALNRFRKASSSDVRELAVRLETALQSGNLSFEAPPFLTTGRMYRQLPNDLKAKLTGSDLAILKGDVNYRRLMDDRHWPPTTPVAQAAGYFPTNFLSLRTLKSELVVGLSPRQLEKLQKEAEPDWLINGKRGLITFLAHHPV